MGGSERGSEHLVGPIPSTLGGFLSRSAWPYTHTSDAAETSLRDTTGKTYRILGIVLCFTRGELTVRHVFATVRCDGRVERRSDGTDYQLMYQE